MSRYLIDTYQPLEAYVPGEQPQDMQYVKLNTNESPSPPSPAVIAAASREAGRLQLYSDPVCANVRDAIAGLYGVGRENVLAANGSDEVLAFAFQAFGGEGLAHPDITYGCYAVWTGLYHLDAKIIPLKEDFTIDPKDYESLDRCVVIANPNAPTGIALPLSAIAQIAKSNPDRVVIVDEAYVGFGADSAVKLLPEYGNILVVRTFSKSRQLAGARLGFALGSEELIGDLNLIRYSFHPYNVNSLTQAAGAAALEDAAYFEDCRQKIMETRAWTKEQLESLGFQVLDSRANFLFAAAPGLGGAEYQKRLREKKILIRYFDQPRIRDFVRITIGSREQMEKLIEATKEILA